MKKIAFALLLSMPCGLINAAMTSDKIYVNSKDVRIKDNGIYVNLDGIVVSVEDLNYDENGISINPRHIKDDYFLKLQACSQCDQARKSRDNA